MGDPDAPPLQAAELVQLLGRHGVRYVVVGGLAATVHGATRVTFDIDLVPEWTDDNLARLAGALQEADAELRAPETVSPISFPVDARSLRQFEVSTWRTRFGDLDVIIGTDPGARRPREIRGSRSESRRTRGIRCGDPCRRPGRHHRVEAGIEPGVRPGRAAGAPPAARAIALTWVGSRSSRRQTRLAAG